MANQPPQTTITITGSPINSKSKNLNKREKKKKKKLKIFNKHYWPTTATNIPSPKLNQPPPQPWHHQRPKIPTQPINQWPKTHTSKPISNLTPTARLRDLKVSGEGCGGWRRGEAVRDLEQRWERSWAGRTKREEIESDGERREKNKVKRKENKKILNQNGISVRTLLFPLFTLYLNDSRKNKKKKKKLYTLIIETYKERIKNWIQNSVNENFKYL